MKIRVIGVPSAWGTKELGARRTPAALRDAGLLEWLDAPGLEVEDGGDVAVPPQTEADSWEARAAAATKRSRGSGLIHLEEVVAVATAVREATREALADGALPLILGGECCLAIGAAAALAAARGPIGIAWLDAHGDLNTPETSESGLITGMPFAALLGHGDAALLEIGAATPRPDPRRVWLLGGRDLDAGEVANLAAFGIHHLPTEEGRAMGPEAVAMKVLEAPEIDVMPPEARTQLAAAGGGRSAEGAGRPGPAASDSGARGPSIYLHFDVDSLDPDVAPGVHYAVPGGFSPAEVGTLAGYLGASGRVGAIAVASANLDHDRDGLTIAAIRDVLVSIADALSLAS